MSVVEENRLLAAKPLKWLVLAGITLLALGCRKPTPDGYRVVSYNGETKQWTIIYSEFDPAIGKSHRRRFLVICDSYELGYQGFSHGSDVCDLQVGELIHPDSGNNGQEHTFVDVTSDQRLYIAQGGGGE